MADVEIDSGLDLSKLKVQDLKRELKNRGLNTSGNKSELIERLQRAMKMNDTICADSVDDLDEELLNEDDDEHLEPNDSVMCDIDSALDESSSQKGQKRKLTDETSPPVNVNKSGPPKKVILNRNTPSIVTQKSTETEEKVEAPKEEKKVIKLSELSAKERLEMRAKKFGVSLSDEAKKIARMERFIGSNNSDTSSIKKENGANLDVLQKRAERFGCSVSTALTKLENQERLERRKARFGIVTNTNGLTDSERAKQRLEKFKQPVK